MTRSLLLAAALLAATSCSSGPSGSASRSEQRTRDGRTSARDGAAPDAPASAGDLGAITWTGYVQSFTASYCVSCHTGTESYSTAFPTGNDDFGVYANVAAVAASIRCGIAPCGMSPPGCVTDAGTPASTGCPGPFGSCPPAGQFPATCSACTSGKCPTRQQRLAIIAWVDSGAPM